MLVDKERKKTYLFAYNLQFFAKEGSGGEKTEEATTKKLDDARKEGQVARSQEFTTAAGLMALFLVLKIFVGRIGTQFLANFTDSYSLISTYGKEEFTFKFGNSLMNHLLTQILIICLPVLLTGFVVAFVVNVFQVKWKVTSKPLQPKLSKINPISGFKKIFSVDKVMDLIKSLLKILVIFIIVYNEFKGSVDMLHEFYSIGSLQTVIILIGNMVINLGIKISALFLVIGLADIIYQKVKFKKDMRMTKQEVKDEFKQTEGDPQIKGKIRQKMRQVSMSRMMQRLPQADVVITNPTHFACALLYDKEMAEAPILVAKGADYLAAKIKEKAKENNVPIVENKPLARMLYYNVDLESEIPKELYQMAAEVLAYVYGLKNSN
ncbi:MAG: flagellar biosynthesis protein FlhB [Clostridiales bacterium]|nr:flagellar biosynthesis protein FlhB [Clostridiales bacterium]